MLKKTLKAWAYADDEEMAWSWLCGPEIEWETRGSGDSPFTVTITIEKGHAPEGAIAGLRASVHADHKGNRLLVTIDSDGNRQCFQLDPLMAVALAGVLESKVEQLKRGQAVT